MSKLFIRRGGAVPCDLAVHAWAQVSLSRSECPKVAWRPAAHGIWAEDGNWLCSAWRILPPGELSDPIRPVPARMCLHSPRPMCLLSPHVQFFSVVGLPLFSAFCNVFPASAPLLACAKANHDL